MVLRQVSWLCTNGSEHIVVEATFNAADIRAATYVADRKSQYINAYDPGGIIRSPEIIRNRIVAGKLADAAVLELLNNSIQRRHLNFTLREYDSFRTNGFRNPDPFDIELIRENNAIQQIEIRSSFCYLLAPVSNIVNKFSIYGWYITANKPAEEPRDWYWQFVYYLRPLGILRLARGPDLESFENQLNAGRVIGYIVGGASKALLITRGSSRRDQGGALYRAIFPISNGLGCQAMLNHMFGTLALD